MTNLFCVIFFVILPSTGLVDFEIDIFNLLLKWLEIKYDKRIKGVNQKFKYLSFFIVLNICVFIEWKSIKLE